MSDIVLKDRNNTERTYTGVTSVELIDSAGNVVEFGGGGGLSLSPWPFDEPNDDATRIYFYGKRFVLNQIGTSQKTIDWGDGTTYEGTGSATSHNYETTGFYCITINGSITFKTSTSHSGPYWYCFQTNQYSLYDAYLKDQICYMSLGKDATLSDYGLCEVPLRGLRLRGKAWILSGSVLYKMGQYGDTPAFIDALDATSLTINLYGNSSDYYPYLYAIYAKKIETISFGYAPSYKKLIVVDDPVVKVNQYGLCRADVMCANVKNKVTVIPQSANTYLYGASIAGDIVIRNMTTMPTISYTKFDELKVEARLTKINTFGYNSAGMVPQIPDTVTAIGDNCFYRFSGGGRNIIIPDSCTSVGTYFCSNSQIDSLTIGTGLTKLPDYFCCYCHYLTSVTIPANITSIGQAFQTCVNLKEVHIQAEEPPALPAGTNSSQCPFVKSGSGSMSQSYSFSAKIYVPKGSAEAYKAAAGWSNMESLILEEPDEKT